MRNSAALPADAPLRVSRRLVNAATNEAQIEFEYRSIIPGTRAVHCVPAALTRSAKALASRLINAGADPTAVTPLTIETALNGPMPTVERTTKRRGWHGTTFVTEAGTFGPEQDLRLECQVSPEKRRAGRLKGWIAGLKGPCRESDFLVLAISAQFAAPLMKHAGFDETPFFYAYGPSSTGKSLWLRVAQSMRQRALNRDLDTFAATPRALEERRERNNDAVTICDEFGRAPGSETQRRRLIRTEAYGATSGRGTQRSVAVARQGLENVEFHTITLGTGEEDIRRLAGHRRLQGEEFRMPVLSIDKDAGVFDRLDGEKHASTRARLARAVESAITENYGVVLAPFAKRLTEKPEELGRRARDEADSFVTKVAGGQPAPVQRFARMFGMVLAGGVVGAELGLAPFSPKRARNAIARLYRRGLEQSGFLGPIADRVALEVARLSRDSAACPRLEPGRALPGRLHGKAIGLKRHDRGRDLVFLLPHEFDRIVGMSASRNAVLDELIARGVALPSSNGKRHAQVQVVGFGGKGRPRMVRFDLSRLRSLLP